MRGRTVPRRNVAACSAAAARGTNTRNQGRKCTRHRQVGRLTNLAVRFRMQFWMRASKENTNPRSNCDRNRPGTYAVGGGGRVVESVNDKTQSESSRSRTSLALRFSLARSKRNVNVVVWPRLNRAQIEPTTSCWPRREYISRRFSGCVPQAFRRSTTYICSRSIDTPLSSASLSGPDQGPDHQQLN